MKVLLLNGSPKRERSDTLRVSRAFIKGLGESDTYQQIDTVSANVKPCLGCFGCWRNGGHCVIKDDDMADILQKIKESDLVIWSFPLYNFSMTAHMKAVMDRMLPLVTGMQETDEEGHTYHPMREEHQVRMMMISGCGFADFEGNYDAMILQFARMFGEDFPRIICVESPLLNIPEAAPVADPYLALCEQAGREFAKDGRISDNTQQKLDAPMLDPEEYRSRINQSW